MLRSDIVLAIPLASTRYPVDRGISRDPAMMEGGSPQRDRSSHRGHLLIAALLLSRTQRVLGVHREALPRALQDNRPHFSP